jgi:hypothetical protein
MLLVMVKTPDRDELIPVSSTAEAQWRSRFERDCAIAKYGNDGRDSINVRVVRA